MSARGSTMGDDTMKTNAVNSCLRQIYAAFDVIYFQLKIVIFCYVDSSGNADIEHTVLPLAKNTILKHFVSERRWRRSSDAISHRYVLRWWPGRRSSKALCVFAMHIWTE